MIFEPILKPKVWGGRRLARFGKLLPQDPQLRIGESWELADMASTSPSGGGGDAAHSVITNGALAGRTIDEAMAAWRERLLGQEIFARQCDAQGTQVPAFPLLLKLLDASEHLSVQVHPSPEYAAAHADAHLKTESWYILDAEPMNDVEPVIFAGLRADIDEPALRKMIAEGTVAQALLAHPAVPGQCYTLPSGTVHALGGGVLVAEVQTASDTTYRLYDWTGEYKREQRELHIDEAVQCITFGAAPPPPAKSAKRAEPVSRLAQTEFYTIDEVRPDGEAHALEGDSCVAIMGIAGAGAITAPGCESVALSAGTTLLVPAACVPQAVIRGNEHLRFLKIGLI
ncbi:MAG: class I mannose-6-phosphate isomerase [Phycisphaerales bacterium]